MMRFLMACTLGFTCSAVALGPGVSPLIAFPLVFFTAYLWHTSPSGKNILPRVHPETRLYAWRLCPAFVARAFHFIHSNARLLFGIDVVIGTAIGYHTGNVWLGGLAGGCWWLFDWHLISVKIMDIKPT